MARACSTAAILCIAGFVAAGCAGTTEDAQRSPVDTLSDLRTEMVNEMRKIGIAVGASSERVYALIEAHDPYGGLYRSDDAGDTWELVNPSHSLWQRPWYYMHVIADPRDENVLYIMNVDSYKSTDGGHLFNKVKVPHGDNHGLWIDPRDSRRMIA